MPRTIKLGANRMKLVEDLGWPVRGLYLVFGVLLATAAVATAWHDWPLVVAHKASGFGFALLLIIALPVALLIIVWACVGRHREWHVHDNHIHIHVISLTSWARVMHIDAPQVETMTLESADYEDRANRTAYWLSVRTTDGKTYLSPKTFDRAIADQAREKVALFGNPDKDRLFTADNSSIDANSP